MSYLDQLPTDPTPVWRNIAGFEAMMAHYDAELERLSVPYQSHYIETRFARTHVLSAGDSHNPPLFLWHGMNINASMYVDWLNALADTFFLIAPDAPGHGGKSDATRLDKKSADYGKWASDVMDAFDISSAHQAGVSMGGWMQLQLASYAPEKIKSASLISSAGFMPVSKMLLVRVLPWGFFGNDVIARRMVKVMSGVDAPPNEDEVRMFKILFDMKTEKTVPIIDNEALAKLSAPTQLLMAEREQTFSPHKVIERAKNVLPNLQHTEILPGMSHGMGENIQLVIDKVRQFALSV